MDKELKKRVLVHLAASPITLFPFLSGVTYLALYFGFGLRNAALSFASLVAIVFSAGAFLTRLLLGAEGTVKKVAEEIQEERDAAREKDLNNLDEQLQEDKDPRTERCLRDLRKFTGLFRESRDSGDVTTLLTRAEILAKVEELFTACIKSLERSLELWQRAQGIYSKAAQKPILDRRESIIEDVQASIRRLGETYAAMAGLGQGEDSGAELDRIRSEVEQSLAVAQRVDEEMADLLRPGQRETRKERRSRE